MKAKDGEYSEEIRRGVIKKERLKEKCEQEKALHAELDSQLKSVDQKTKRIRVKSATLRDKVLYLWSGWVFKIHLFSKGLPITK